MINTLLVLSLVGFVNTDPFAPKPDVFLGHNGMTVSYEKAGITVLNMEYSRFSIPFQKDPPEPGIPVNSAVTTAMEAAVHTELPACAITSEAAGIPNPEPVPTLEEISDWNSIYAIHIGIQLEGVGDFKWADAVTVIARVGKLLNHVKALVQEANGMYLSQVGVKVIVDHVAFVDEPYAVSNQANANTNTRARWRNKSNHFPAVSTVWRLGGKIPDAYASIGTTCGDRELWPRIARSLFYDLYHLRSSTDLGDWHALAIHELTHAILKLSHTQCYRDGNGNPIEFCPDGSCWTGPTICPALTDISIMGYCGCWFPSNNDGHWPNLRLGPPFEAMTRLARKHVLEYASQCLDPPIDWQPRETIPPDFSYILDGDGDGIPNALDTCAEDSNPSQTDADVDNKGDVCDKGCSVGEPEGPAWTLFLPAILIGLLRFKTHRRSSR